MLSGPAPVLCFDEQCQPCLSLSEAGWLCPTGTLRFPDWVAVSRVESWEQEVFV